MLTQRFMQRQGGGRIYLVVQVFRMNIRRLEISLGQNNMVTDFLVGEENVTQVRLNEEIAFFLKRRAPGFVSIFV